MFFFLFFFFLFFFFQAEDGIRDFCLSRGLGDVYKRQQGERYYWVLYYSYLSSTKPENIDEILDKLEPHFPQYARVHRTTYFRWREQAFEAVGSILWGYEGESERVLKLVCEDYEEK